MSEEDLLSYRVGDLQNLGRSDQRHLFVIHELNKTIFGVLICSLAEAERIETFRHNLYFKLFLKES